MAHKIRWLRLRQIAICRTATLSSRSKNHLGNITIFHPLSYIASFKPFFSMHYVILSGIMVGKSSRRINTLFCSVVTSTIHEAPVMWVRRSKDSVGKKWRSLLKYDPIRVSYFMSISCEQALVHTMIFFKHN